MWVTKSIPKSVGVVQPERKVFAQTQDVWSRAVRLTLARSREISRTHSGFRSRNSLCGKALVKFPFAALGFAKGVSGIVGGPARRVLAHKVTLGHPCPGPSAQWMIQRSFLAADLKDIPITSIVLERVLKRSQNCLYNYSLLRQVFQTVAAARDNARTESGIHRNKQCHLPNSSKILVIDGKGSGERTKSEPQCNGQ